MLFNSYAFILGFLPIALAATFAARRWGGARAAMGVLVAASVAFYAWWSPPFVLLLAASLAFNYGTGGLIRREARPRARWWLTAAGVAANLAVLAWFKYAGFFSGGWLAAGVLPLGISFITFQKIAYLVDSFEGRLGQQDFASFALFVTFYPQLIAGPIVHHAEVMPQFQAQDAFRFRWEAFVPGLVVFAAGLAKKTLLADHVAPYADHVFQAADIGARLTAIEAWGGAAAYALQIYFDFSGYSDMALGLAFMVGIRLPLNFDSPYRAASIVEFWRRWHMTLSRFLRDYLYIALGGNRRGKVRRYVNLAATMVLGGLWHGAAWTFVAWGALHGAYLVVNHGWRALRGRWEAPVGRAERLAGHALTLAAVVVAWVYFRASSMAAAHVVLAGMAGANGVVLGPLPYFNGAWPFAWVLGLGAIALFAPNVHQVMGALGPALDRGRLAATRLRWAPTPGWAAAAAAAAVLGGLGLAHVSPFLYFQF